MGKSIFPYLLLKINIHHYFFATNPKSPFSTFSTFCCLCCPDTTPFIPFFACLLLLTRYIIKIPNPLVFSGEIIIYMFTKLGKVQSPTSTQFSLNQVLQEPVCKDFDDQKPLNHYLPSNILHLALKMMFSTFNVKLLMAYSLAKMKFR